MYATARTRRFTVDEYYRMGDVGILRPDERVELIEGEIIVKEPMGSPHAACVSQLTRILSLGVEDDALVRVQLPLRISDISEPVSDCTVVRARADHYAAAHPRPADVLLVIEVAESTLRLDRKVKGPLYALSGIAEYWLIDLNSDVIDVHHKPGEHGYDDVQRYSRGSVLDPIALPGLSIAVADILPDRNAAL